MTVFILTASEAVLLAAAIRGPYVARVQAAPRAARQLELHLGKTAEPAANRAAHAVGQVPVIAIVGKAEPTDGRRCAHLLLCLL